MLQRNVAAGGGSNERIARFVSVRHISTVRASKSVRPVLNGRSSLPVIEPVPARTTEHFSGYHVRLTSVGPYRIFGYLSVPTGTGPFPALLETPRYGSVINPPHFDDRMRYVVFTFTHRGQRLSDQPFAAGSPAAQPRHLG